MTANPISCVEFDGARNAGGYGAVRHAGKVVRAHRLAYCQANGLRLEDIAGQSVRHSCDNPACVNPAHLALGTHTDNMRDMAERGRNRQPKGERNAKSKLTESQIRELRARAAEGESQRALGREFGVHPSVVCRAVNGKRWSHVA